MDRIDRLADRLRQLKRLDRSLSVFGARRGHRYRLNPCLPGEELSAFEDECGVTLPADYRSFLTRIGNGGAGPHYGVYSLEEAVSKVPRDELPHFLGHPFPLSEAFNPSAEDATDDGRFNDKYICGSILLADQGCGYYDRLVVTGPQHGQVWSDGRVSAQGLRPLGVDFYRWYEAWLVAALASVMS